MGTDSRFPRVNLTLISKVAGCESKWNLAREPKTSGADQCRGCSRLSLSRTSKLGGREIKQKKKTEKRDEKHTSTLNNMKP